MARSAFDPRQPTSPVSRPACGRCALRSTSGSRSRHAGQLGTPQWVLPVDKLAVSGLRASFEQIAGYPKRRAVNLLGHHFGLVTLYLVKSGLQSTTGGVYSPFGRIGTKEVQV